MPTFPAPRTYLQQARADFRACQLQTSDFAECHRRYFLQQAFEKALKSFLLVKLGVGNEDEQVEFLLRDTILGSHSPLADFPPGADLAELEEQLVRRYPKHWERGIKLLKMLRREAAGLIERSGAGPVLRKIDGTRQSIRAQVPSYRYPFFEDRLEITPATWGAWDTYQGTWHTVVPAVHNLIETVALTVGTSGRRSR
jgi:hypothetical protein